MNSLATARFTSTQPAEPLHWVRKVRTIVVDDLLTVVEGMLEVPGVGVGCVSNVTCKTGTTVVLLPRGCRGAVDIGGGAPATRETPVLDPANSVAGPDAIVLTGGSAVGLRTADGVMEMLQGLHRGVLVGEVAIPIVVAAAIFDMGVGHPQAPTVDDGRRAAQIAYEGNQSVQAGAYGAGAGATVGKLLGMEKAMAGGQAAVTLKTPDGLLVAALVVVNAMGSILDEKGHIVAGPLVEGHPQSTLSLWAKPRGEMEVGGATTIGVVLSNAKLSKAELSRVARMSHDGLARCIEPAHTPWDGDTLFAVSVGDRPEDVGRVGALAGHAVARAIRLAVGRAKR